MKNISKSLLGSVIGATMMVTNVTPMLASQSVQIQSDQSYSIGQTTSGVLSSKDYSVSLKFELNKSGRVTFKVNCGCIHSLYLYQGNTDTSLWSRTFIDSNSGLEGSEYSFDLEAGNYLFVLSSYSPIKEGDGVYYTISSSFIEANADEIEPNNDAASSTFISANQVYNGLLSKVKGVDNDFYKFNIDHAGVVSINIKSYIECYSFYLLDSKGDNVFSSTYIRPESSANFSEKDFILHLQKGDYYIRITSPYSDDTGTYSLEYSFQSEGKDEIESNDTQDQATKVTLNKTYNGLLTKTSKGVEVDNYSFTIPAGQKVTLNETSYIAPTYRIIIFNEKGQSVFDKNYLRVNDSLGRAEESFELDLDPGLYYLQFAPCNGYTGKYSFTLSTNGGSISDDSNDENSNQNDQDSDSLTSSIYPDVSGSNLDYFGILYSKDHKIMTGYENGTFGPENNLTRGELITILHRMEGTPVSHNSGFNDVPNYSFYKAATNWAKETGVLTGNLHPDGTWTFDGQDPVTRQDAALILYRYAKNIKGNASMGPLSDYYYRFDNEVGSWAKEGVRWAISNNILRLNNNSAYGQSLQETLNPRDNSKRGWIATAIQRYLDPNFVGKYNPESSEFTGTFTLNTSLSNQLQKGAFNSNKSDCLKSISLSNNGDLKIEYENGKTESGKYQVKTTLASTYIQVLMNSGSSWSWPCISRNGTPCIITSNGLLTK